MIRPDAWPAWRKIEDAPKDGTFVLCYVDFDQGMAPMYVVGAYFGRQFGFDWWSDETSSNEFVPTHFMLLPQPPEPSP